MIPEPVLRMFRHPDSNKVLSVVSPDGFPHSIVLGGLIVDDEDRLYVGEAYMYRTAQYLEECPNAEFLAWKGKDGYSLKAVAVGRLTEGPEFERMREMLERKNMRAVAVWVFKSVEVWDESGHIGRKDTAMDVPRTRSAVRIVLLLAVLSAIAGLVVYSRGSVLPGVLLLIIGVSVGMICATMLKFMSWYDYPWLLNGHGREKN